MTVVSLILAGGSGSRLWPLSRKNMPKQLLTLFGERTLLQETCNRLFPIIGNQWIVTGNEYYHQVISQIEQLQESYLSKQISSSIRVLQEPLAKNTAPPIFWVARYCQELYGDDTILVVLPSDHLINMEENFRRDIIRAVKAAREGNLVTFGVKPSYPETGYGYIKAVISKGDCYQVDSFVEKPDLATAKGYLNSGDYYWNSGMFVFNIDTLLSESERYCPGLIKPFIESDPTKTDEVRNAYLDVQPQSIDYAVMEKTEKALVVPASFGWSDIGSWDSLFQSYEHDENGNYIRGEHVAIDCKGCLIHGKDRFISALGLESVIIIDTADVLLVSSMNQSQRIKEIVEDLKKTNPRYL